MLNSGVGNHDSAVHRNYDSFLVSIKLNAYIVEIVVKNEVHNAVALLVGYHYNVVVVKSIVGSFIFYYL